METKLSILFYSKTSKITRDGLVPIYLRVTINGVRFNKGRNGILPYLNGLLMQVKQKVILKKPEL